MPNSCGATTTPPGIELASANDNVVMTRTFSKLYGLAGLRLGWAYAPAHVIDAIERVRMPFNVNLVAQAVGIAAHRGRRVRRRNRSRTTTRNCRG